MNWIEVKESFAGRQPHSLVPAYLYPDAGRSQLRQMELDQDAVDGHQCPSSLTVSLFIFSLHDINY